MKTKNISIFAFAPILMTLMAATQAGDHGMKQFKTFPSDTHEWKEGPPSLPPGAMIDVLEGDPSKEGPFVFRIKAPDGYQIPVHTHPKTERVTVISGTFNIGMGETFEKSNTKPMPAGTYGFWETGMKHYVWVKGETIVQFHGTGPWKIEYANPKDDPRNQAKASK